MLLNPFVVPSLSSEDIPVRCPWAPVSAVADVTLATCPLVPHRCHRPRHLLDKLGPPFTCLLRSFVMNMFYYSYLTPCTWNCFTLQSPPPYTERATFHHGVQIKFLPCKLKTASNDLIWDCGRDTLEARGRWGLRKLFITLTCICRLMYKEFFQSTFTQAKATNVLIVSVFIRPQPCNR
jgi:hypothetical protein